MKKFITLTLALSMLLVSAVFFAGCGGHGRRVLYYPTRSTFDRNHDYVGTTINVANWGYFMADGTYGSLNIIRTFERMTGINVNFMLYNSNEEVYSLVTAGAHNFDIIIPSEYMVERMRAENLLRPLNFDLIPNFEFIQSPFLNRDFDPGNVYSVPYKYGYVGLIYNARIFAEHNIPSPTCWYILFDRDIFGSGGVGNGMARTINNRRDAFAIAQTHLGLDVNSTNPTDWEAAAALLTEQFGFVRPIMDEIYEDLPAEHAWVGAYYVGDFLRLQEMNEDLRFVFPEAGTNMFINSVVIPTTSRTENQGPAHMFINFLLEPEVANENAAWVRYASPNRYVTNEPMLADSPDKYFIFRHIPEMTATYTRLWTDIIAS